MSAIAQEFKTYEQHVSAAAASFTKRIREKAMAGRQEDGQLYCKKAGPNLEGELALFFLSEQPGEGWELVTPEKLGINIAYDRYHQWIHSRAQSAPILGYAEKTLPTKTQAPRSP